MTDKKIKRISDKQRKEKAKRDEFESKIEVYMVEDVEYPHYALLHPHWPKLSSKKLSYYTLMYYPVDEDQIMVDNGSVDRIVDGGRFNTYKEFKKFLNTGKLRNVSEFEEKMLKMNNRFRGHFNVSDVEDITLGLFELERLDKIFDNSRR